MFKKLSLLFFVAFLFGCESTITSRGGTDDNNLDISEVDVSSQKSFRVGVLLPLSGSAAKYGQGLKNATLMALDDIKNNNLILQYYDTKGTPEGARIAIENALNQKSDLIIGPLMSTEVKAISPRTTSYGVPVIAFSTSQEVLQYNVYSMGLLIDEQVDRIISFAALQGRRNFALMLPDNDTGVAVARAAVLSARKNDVTIVKMGFYPPNMMDFSAIAKDMTGYIPDRKTAANPGFDAILIPESGYRLKSAIAMFGYYDVYSPKVKFLGTSIWEGTALNRETAAVGGWYPALSRVNSAYFSKKYSETFGEKPNSLYSLAYDAVALSTALARQQNSDLSTALARPEGYIGINGVFRLFQDGTNQHSLDVMEVRSTGDVVVDSAPRKFSVEQRENLDGLYHDTNPIMPQIFGKDAASVRRLVYEYRPVRQEPTVSDTLGLNKIRSFGYWGF